MNYLLFAGLVIGLVLGIAGVIDSFRFPLSAWDSIRHDRNVTAILLGLTVVLWILAPVLPFYWLYLRPRMARAMRDSQGGLEA